MPQFSANLSLLFADLPFLDRFDAAARAGFQAVEFQFPYDFAVADIKARLNDTGLALVLHNLPAGDWAAGERGLACHPDRVAEFQHGVLKALEVAAVLGTPQLNVLAGLLPTGVAQADARRTLVANLRYAASLMGDNGIRLLMEPINTRDMPGFFVNRTEQALDILDEVGSANLLLQYDIYHAQRMEGELGATLAAHLSRIGHIQLADNPGRHEPGTGEINFHYLFRHLDDLGYRGHVGCEYRPRDAGPGGTLAGLGWVAAHGQRLSPDAAQTPR